MTWRLNVWLVIPLLATVIASSVAARADEESGSKTDQPGDIVIDSVGGEVVLNVLPGFPEELPDGRIRTRYEVRAADGDPWKYRCFQPDRFVDLSDPAKPVYAEEDWSYIEFDVIEPLGETKEHATWLVLADSGGSSIALDQDVAEGLDVSDPSSQDSVIMPWPGSLLAEDCSGTPVHCRLKASSTSGLFSKLNEGGLWRTKSDNAWRGEKSSYEGFPMASHQNRLVQYVRKEAPDWGFVQFSGCARDNSAGDRSLGPHRDRDPWGYEAVRAGLDFVQARYHPDGFFITGLSSGGVSTMILASRLGSAPFVDIIKGYVPDAGGADYIGYANYQDIAHLNNGWLYLSERNAFSNCASADWSITDVFTGVMRKAIGLQAQNRLSDTATGSCVDEARGTPCFDAPVFFSTASRDRAVICSSDEMFDAVYGPAWHAVQQLRRSGVSAGHGFFLDEVADSPDTELCLESERATPECTAPPPASMTIDGDQHCLQGLPEYRRAALRWMRCILAAGEDPGALNDCARSCRTTSAGTTCLCGEADEPCD